VVELRKSSGGRHRGAKETTLGDLLVILALLFIMTIMTTGFNKIGAICCGWHITASVLPVVLLKWS